MTGLPALLGALGLVGVIFALLDLVLAIFGAPMDPYWIGGNLGLGAVLLVVAAVLGADALRERLRSGEARRAGVSDHVGVTVLEPEDSGGVEAGIHARHDRDAGRRLCSGGARRSRSRRGFVACEELVGSAHGRRS